MSGMAILASILLAPAPIVAASHQVAEPTQIDVGYPDLAAGMPAAAEKRIVANHNLDSQDPARLINLGTAYANQGRNNDAEQMFKAAILSDARYQLELADGSWLDSREAARQALARLQRGQLLARR